MMKTYLAAVSGGSDSMSLLDKYKKQIKVVCHINYCKRNSAIRDENIVRNYCEKNNIIFAYLKCTDKVYKKYKKKDNNFQHIARKIRYDFFVKMGIKYGCKTLLVAHNFDDSIETAYMQMMKKSKSLFYGIKKENFYDGLKISRPLLKYRKIELENYCKKNKIPYGVDESNFMDIYERNRVRKYLAKLSKEEFTKLVNTIKKYNSKNKSLYNKVEKSWSIWTKNDFNINLLKKLNDKVVFNLIYKFLSKNNENNISSGKIDGIIKFINCSNGKRYRLSDKQYLTIKNNNLLFN